MRGLHDGVGLAHGEQADDHRRGDRVADHRITGLGQLAQVKAMAMDPEPWATSAVIVAAHMA